MTTWETIDHSLADMWLYHAKLPPTFELRKYSFWRRLVEEDERRGRLGIPSFRD